MKLIVHKMEECPLCDKCIKLLKHWKIQHKSAWDWFEPKRPYPYITIELEYEELVEWISKGVFEK